MFLVIRPAAARLAAAATLALCLAACVETGDFGRVKTHSAWNDVLGAAGTVSAAARGEPVSGFGLTDDEEELRGRAWRFLVPAHERAWFARALADLVATRIVPADVEGGDPATYFAALGSEDSRSPASRYRRLSEDIAADGRLLGPVAAVAGRVLAADTVRLRTLDYAREVSLADRDGAWARVSENRCLVAWVATGLDRRLVAYRFALEHLVIETPQAEAIAPERALAGLLAARAAVGTLGVPPLAAASCLGERAPVPIRRLPLAVPLVRKG